MRKVALLLLITITCLAAYTAYAAYDFFLGETITKQDLREPIDNGLAAGASRQEVEKYLGSLKVKGVRASKYDYVRDESGQSLTVKGKEVEVDGTIFAVIRGGRQWPFFDNVGVIFYFDKSQRLVEYHVDYFGSR